MVATDFVDSTQSLMNSGEEPGPPASQCRGSPKWRIASLVFGLAIGTAFTVHSRRGRSLAPLGTDGITILTGGPDELEIPITIRDFRENHPDMQRDDSGLNHDLVETTLGSDRKPVYVGGPTIESEDSFNQWYNDDPTNQKIDSVLTITKEAGTDKFVADLPGYFPIDGEGWNDHRTHAGTDHNYYFTLEMHHRFKYHGGENFKFRGDDDLWVFINDQKVIDLGGTHVALEDSIDLDTLNLVAEQEYNLDLFFAERACCESNFRIETTIALDEAVSSSATDSQDNRCCLISAINFLCFDERQWWTIWC